MSYPIFRLKSEHFLLVRGEDYIRSVIFQMISFLKAAWFIEKREEKWEWTRICAVYVIREKVEDLGMKKEREKKWR